MGKLIKFPVLVVPFLLISYYAIRLTYTTYERNRDYTPEEAARIAKSLNVGLSDFNEFEGRFQSTPVNRIL